MREEKPVTFGGQSPTLAEASRTLCGQFPTASGKELLVDELFEETSSVSRPKPRVRPSKGAFHAVKTCLTLDRTQSTLGRSKIRWLLTGSRFLLLLLLSATNLEIASEVRRSNITLRQMNLFQYQVPSSSSNG